MDEADYLLADDMANLKKVVKEDKRIYLYIVFFSKYINPTSDAARINEHNIPAFKPAKTFVNSLQK